MPHPVQGVGGSRKLSGEWRKPRRPPPPATQAPFLQRQREPNLASSPKEVGPEEPGRGHWTPEQPEPHFSHSPPTRAETTCYLPRTGTQVSTPLQLARTERSEFLLSPRLKCVCSAVGTPETPDPGQHG